MSCFCRLVSFMIAVVILLSYLYFFLYAFVYFPVCSMAHKSIKLQVLSKPSKPMQLMSFR